MALPDGLRIVEGTPQISLRDHAGTAPTTANDLEIGTPTDVDMTPGTLASLSYHQSDKWDFGANRHALYHVMAACENSVLPTAGGAWQFWVAPSHNSTAANANPGNVSGVDGAYNGYGAAAADADEAIFQLHQLQSLVVTADVDVHIGTLGFYIPYARYASLVMKNNTSQAMGPDDNEFQVVFTPVEYQIQD